LNNFSGAEHSYVQAGGKGGVIWQLSRQRIEAERMKDSLGVTQVQESELDTAYRKNLPTLYWTKSENGPSGLSQPMPSGPPVLRA